jgi:hypothetical protein
LLIDRTPLAEDLTMRFFSSMTRVLRVAVVSLLALGVAVAGLLLGAALAASVLVLAALKRLHARRAAPPRRSAARAPGRLDVVDVAFREKRWSE